MERIKLDRERKAVPMPPGLIDPEAVKNALANFYAAVRADKVRPREEPQRRPWRNFPLD